MLQNKHIRVPAHDVHGGDKMTWIAFAMGFVFGAVFGLLVGGLCIAVKTDTQEPEDPRLGRW